MRGPTKIIGVVLSIAACTARADDSGTPPGEKRVWLNAGMYSRHFERDKGFRGNNYGLGVEVALSQRDSIATGFFRNSDDRRSNYAAWLWKPLEFGPARIGLALAAFDGYPRVRNGGWFPAVFPVASGEYRAVGANIALLPSYGDRLHGALVVQLKLRVW